MVPGVRLIGEVLLSWLVAFGTAEGPKPPAPPPAPTPSPFPPRRFDPKAKPAPVDAPKPLPPLPDSVWADPPKPPKRYEFVGPPMPPVPAIVCDFTLDPEPRPKAEPPKPAPQWWTDSTRPGIEIFGVLDPQGRVVVERWRWAGQTQEFTGAGPTLTPAPAPQIYHPAVQWYFQAPGGS